MTGSVRPRSLVPALIVAALAAACSAGPAGPSAGSDDGRLSVVATTTVLADIVRQVGGDRVEVASLVPRGAEVHTFDPDPTDAERLVRARLIVMNGLGLDDWLAGLATKAGATGTLLRLAESLPGATYLGADGEPVMTDEAADPHLWLAVPNGRRYAARIADALASLDPSGATTYRAAAQAYDARLSALDASIRTTLGSIPAADRRIVSFHDAFPYFAAAYGLTVVGTVVASPGQDPSAGDVAALVRTIRETGVRAILSEAQFNPAVARTIATETGVPIVADLYTDSLGPAPADSYEGILRWDADRIAGVLR